MGRRKGREWRSAEMRLVCGDRLGGKDGEDHREQRYREWSRNSHTLSVAPKN